MWLKLMFTQVSVDDGQNRWIEPTPLLLALLQTVDSLKGQWHWEGNRIYRVPTAISDGGD